ncbi:ATP phosphoribosyltransferase regulatory subunit [Sessilibacter corallicola]|uniref:ATP phosphoribosyltransferase regulatory subunit n=1 Tax=Sessilibacter corallicola TaxID=2904075 RepID=UPI001E44BE88|nr:ATP phosphoribosyltransferase regulatory subunit [Sessilibacter corallicola]MCE2027623.1 ATP phosphoribosyltransferase regulatory subunit [Sessilibacter corallicola]
MNYEDRWLLPDGIEEILPESADQIESLRRQLLDAFRLWGYELVIPPMIEYTDSLLIGLGQDIDLLTFRVTDQLSGRMMGIRADITPQIARMDAHSFSQEGVSRLCYTGHVLHTKPKTPLATRSPLQAGVELFGGAGVESDIEVITLLLESLQQLDLPKLHLDLGHVAIYRTLAEEAEFTKEQEQEFFQLLQRKSATDIDRWVNEHVKKPQHKKWLLKLPELAGGPEIIDTAREFFKGAPAAIFDALDQLSKIAQTIGQRCNFVNMYFDLGEVRGYHYHTGVVFAAFASGFGEAIARGGRYDSIGKVFGRARAAIGFTVDITSVSQLTLSQSGQENLIWAPYSEDQNLWSAVRRLRDEGRSVIAALDKDDDIPAKCKQQLVFVDGEYQVLPL